MPSLRQTIARIARAGSVQATVLGSSANKVTVQLDSGAVLTNLPLTGGPVSTGQRIMVSWYDGKPAASAPGAGVAVTTTSVSPTSSSVPASTPIPTPRPINTEPPIAVTIGDEVNGNYISYENGAFSFHAGDDVVIIDANGIKVLADSAGGPFLNRYIQFIGTNGDPILQLYAYQATATENLAYLKATQYDSRDTSLSLSGTAGVYIDGHTEGIFALSNLDVDGDITFAGEISSAAWADYSSSSTIVGWSSFTGKVIRYKRIGKFCYVMYWLSGTSDSATTTFTLPYTLANDGAYVDTWMRSADNGTFTATGFLEVVPNTATAKCYKDASASNNWTTSGNKYCIGQFFYQVA